MSDNEVLPTGTKVTYHGSIARLNGLPMTVAYKSSCSSCAHGGTYALNYTAADGTTKRLEKVLRTSFTVIQ